MSNDMSATKQFPESITANVLRGYSVQCSICTICAGLAAESNVDFVMIHHVMLLTNVLTRLI